jgi:glycosyltransferase involved in cell wall biosynthesis
VLAVGAAHAHAGRALESLRRQDYRPVELVVVGSHLADLRALAEGYFERIQWVEHESPALGSQLNAAIQECRAELIAFLDAGSEWTPGKLNVQVPHLLRRQPAQAYALGRTRHILEPGTRYPAHVIDGLAFRKSLGDSLGTLLAPRLLFEQLGGFTTELHGLEETDWLLRARDAGFSQIMLPDVLLTRIVRPDAQVPGTDQMKTALLEAVRASVHRKRTTAK